MNTRVIDSQLIGHSLSRIFAGRFANLFYAFSYCSFLLGMYYFYIYSEWAYFGFYWNPSNRNFALLIIFVSLISMITPTRTDVRAIFLTICCYMHFFPSIVLFYASGAELDYLLVLLIGVFPLYFMAFIPAKRITYFEFSWRDILRVCVFINILTLGLIIYYSGLKNFNLDYSEIYTYRADANANMPAFLGYLRPMTTKVFLPIMIMIAFSKNNLAMQCVSIAIVLLFFAFTNHKSVIASTLVSLIIMYLFRRQNSVRILPILFIFLMIFSAGVYILHTLTDFEFGSVFLSLIIRRTLFIPSLLDLNHVDYFLTEQYTFWSQSKISFGLIDRVYEINTPFLIGSEYFGRESMAANTGFIGAGFSNAGYIGVMIYAIIIGAVISYLNQVGHQCGRSIVVGASFTQIIGAVTSSDLPSVFLTNGLILLILFFMMFPRRPI